MEILKQDNKIYGVFTYRRQGDTGHNPCKFKGIVYYPEIKRVPNPRAEEFKRGCLDMPINDSQLIDMCLKDDFGESSAAGFLWPGNNLLCFVKVYKQDPKTQFVYSLRKEGPLIPLILTGKYEPADSFRAGETGEAMCELVKPNESPQINWSNVESSLLRNRGYLPEVLSAIREHPEKFYLKE